MLADMAVNLELSRLITYKAAVDADNGIKRWHFQLVIQFSENIYFYLKAQSCKWKQWRFAYHSSSFPLLARWCSFSWRQYSVYFYKMLEISIYSSPVRTMHRLRSASLQTRPMRLPPTLFRLLIDSFAAMMLTFRSSAERASIASILWRNWWGTQRSTRFTRELAR